MPRRNASSGAPGARSRKWPAISWSVLSTVLRASAGKVRAVLLKVHDVQPCAQFDQGVGHDLVGMRRRGGEARHQFAQPIEGQRGQRRAIEGVSPQSGVVRRGGWRASNGVRSRLRRPSGRCGSAWQRPPCRPRWRSRCSRRLRNRHCKRWKASIAATFTAMAIPRKLVAGMAIDTRSRKRRKCQGQHVEGGHLRQDDEQIDRSDHRRDQDVTQELQDRGRGIVLGGKEAASHRGKGGRAATLRPRRDDPEGAHKTGGQCGRDCREQRHRVIAYRVASGAMPRGSASAGSSGLPAATWRRSARTS